MLNPLFPSLFLCNNIQFYVRNNPLQRFSTRKMYSMSLKALKEQFLKMTDAGKRLDLLPQCLILREILKISACDSKWIYTYVYDKNKTEIFRGFLRCLRHFCVIFRRFFYNFRKNKEASLRDIFGNASFCPKTAL